MDGMGILFGKHGFPMVTFCILFLVGKHMHVSSKKHSSAFVKELFLQEPKRKQ